MRSTVATLTLALLATGPALAQQASVFMTEGCGCCHAWVAHMEEAGFDVAARSLPMGSLMQEKLAAGIGPGISSCHTARIDGYVVEGHVPAEIVRRLLAERPDAVGLAVPGMPVGSPGMGEVVEEAYDVLLLRRDGSTDVYATVPAGG